MVKLVMASKHEIRITSKQTREFNHSFALDGLTYQIQTEDLGRKSKSIITNIYLQGELVFQRKTVYAHLLKLVDFESRLKDLMEGMHKSAIEQFKAKKKIKAVPKSEYTEQIKRLLLQSHGKAALAVIREALERFPDDAYLLSHYGYLIAVYEQKIKEGTRICEDAISRLSSLPFGADVFSPLFYLNLGKVYLKALNRKKAFEAFQEGLKSDPSNKDILAEVKKMGIRKSPPVSLLDRSNPVNKYLGKLIHPSSRN